MALQYWDDEERTAWDTLYINGVAWPGIAKVSGTGASSDLNMKKVSGKDGSTVHDKGRKSNTFTLTLTFTEEEEWEQLQTLIKDILPRGAGGAREAVSIGFPPVNFLGIDKGYPKQVSFPDLDKGTQICSLGIVFVEWTPKPKTLKKGAGTKNGQTTQILGTNRVEESLTIKNFGAGKAVSGVADLASNAVNQEIARLSEQQA